MRERKNVKIYTRAFFTEERVYLSSGFLNALHFF